MKVYLDRNYCIRWSAACESCFANHLVSGTFDTTDCVLDVVEDEDPQITFFMRDRDKEQKLLVVDENNWADAYDSWMLLYEKQQADQ